jgi:hypothetical protein
MDKLTHHLEDCFLLVHKAVYFIHRVVQMLIGLVVLYSDFDLVVEREGGASEREVIPPFWLQNLELY